MRFHHEIILCSFSCTLFTLPLSILKAAHAAPTAAEVAEFEKVTFDTLRELAMADGFDTRLIDSTYADIPQDIRDADWAESLAGCAAKGITLDDADDEECFNWTLKLKGFLIYMVRHQYAGDGMQMTESLKRIAERLVDWKNNHSPEVRALLEADDGLKMIKLSSIIAATQNLIPSSLCNLMVSAADPS